MKMKMKMKMTKNVADAISDALNGLIIDARNGRCEMLDEPIIYFGGQIDNAREMADDTITVTHSMKISDWWNLVNLLDCLPWDNDDIEDKIMNQVAGPIVMKIPTLLRF